MIVDKLRPYYTNVIGSEPVFHQMKIRSGKTVGVFEWPAGTSRLGLLSVEIQRATAAPQLQSTVKATELAATYACSSNADGIHHRISFRPASVDGDKVLEVGFGDERGDHSILCGMDSWHEGETTATGWQLHHSYQPDVMRVVASAVWTTSSVLILQWYFIETPVRDTVKVTCERAGEIKWERSTNTNSGAAARPAINARPGR